MPPPDYDAYNDSSDSPSSSEDDYDRPPSRHSRRPPTPPPSPSSSTPYLVVGSVMIILAAIAASTYILTRSGGSLSSSLSFSSSTTAASSGTIKPTAVTTGGSSGGGSSSAGENEDTGENEDGNEEEEASQTTANSKPSKTSASNDGGDSAPSPSKTSKPSTGASNLNLDFTTLSSASELDSYLSSNGLRVSTDHIGSEPITHTFVKENIDWVDGSLRMIVKGQSGNGDISSSEFATSDAFLYGTVTTRLKASDVPGVCHGIFFYTNDNLEVDIELLTSYYTTGLGDAVKPGLQLTNQALVPKQPSTNVVVPYGFDPTTDFHDYTIEWKEGSSTFFVDGKQVGQLTKNVPSEPMKFIWNSWSSGEPNWSAGPPREDSYLYIESISANWTVAS